VQEDAYLPKKNDKASAIIPDNNGWTAPETRDLEIISVVSVKLQPDSPRKGTLTDHKGWGSWIQYGPVLTRYVLNREFLLLWF